MAGILPLLERYDNTPFKETINKVYDTISQMLPNQIQVQTSLLNNVQFISDPLPSIESEVFTKIFEAIKLHKTISFGYRSIKATEHTPHSLDPYKIYCQKGDWYAVGFCHKHNKYSTYNLSRMKDITFLSEFEPDPDYESKVYIDPNFGIGIMNIRYRKSNSFLINPLIRTFWKEPGIKIKTAARKQTVPFI